MNARRRAGWLLAGVALALCASCALRPPFAVVNVLDADQLADEATALVVQAGPEAAERRLPLEPGELADGAVVTLVAMSEGPRPTRIEARDRSGAVLGRALVELTFTSTEQPAVEVVLQVPCDPSDGESAQAPAACRSVPGCGVGRCTEVGVCACGACGDGRPDPGEQCDDGDDDNPFDGCHACQVSEWVPEVVVGLASGPLEIPFASVEAISVDQDGNLYFAATDLGHGQAVWRVDATTGFATRFAGGGEIPLTEAEDGAVATTLDFPIRDLEVDGLGDLYVATGGAVLQIERAGTTRIVAGGASCAVTFSGLELPAEGVPARSACFDDASGLGVGGNGDLFIADRLGHVVLRVDASTGMLAPFAGTGLGSQPAPGQEGAGATLFPLESPSEIALDEEGRLFVLTEGAAGQPALRLIEDGDARTFAASVGVDEVPEVAVYGRATLLLATSQGLLYVDPGGEVSGFGEVDPGWPWPDGQPRASAVAVDNGGRIHFFHVDARELWRWDGEDTVQVAGSGGRLPCCDGVPGTAVRLGEPEDLAQTPTGEVLITSPLERRIRRLDAGWRIHTLVGTGVGGPPRPDRPLDEQRIQTPRSVAVADDGTIFFADAVAGASAPHIRRVSPATEVLETVGGAQVGRPLLVGGEGEGAVTDLLLDPLRGWVLYIDEAASVVRRLDVASGETGTVVGVEDWSGELAPGVATDTWLDDPSDLAFGPDGRLYVTDEGAGALYRVDLEQNALCSLVAGLGASGPACDEGAADAVPDFYPVAVDVDVANTVWVATPELLYTLPPGGTLSLRAGTGLQSEGDGGPALEAGFTRLKDVIVDDKGVTLLDEDRVRRLEEERVTTVAGPIHLGDGPLDKARLHNPQALTQSGPGSFLVADGAAGRVRRLDFEHRALATVVGYPGGFGWAEDARNLAAFRELLAGASGVAFDGETGAIYVSEQERHVVHRVGATAAGNATGWSITPFVGFPDDEGAEGGTLSGTRLSSPAGLAFDEGEGVLFIADRGSHTVRSVRTLPGADVTTEVVLGTPGQRGVIADGVPAREAYLNGPSALAVVRGEGGVLHLYVADTDNHRVLRVTDPLSEDASSTVVVGDGAPNSSGEGQPARFFPVQAPAGLAVDEHGNLYATSASTIRQVLAGPDGLAGGEDEVRTLYGRAPRSRFPEPVTQCLTDIDVEKHGGGMRLLALDACQGFVISLTQAPVDVPPPHAAGFASAPPAESE